MTNGIRINSYSSTHANNQALLADEALCNSLLPSINWQKWRVFTSQAIPMMARVVSSPSPLYPSPSPCMIMSIPSPPPRAPATSTSFTLMCCFRMNVGTRVWSAEIMNVFKKRVLVDSLPDTHYPTTVALHMPMTMIDRCSWLQSAMTPS